MLSQTKKHQDLFDVTFSLSPFGYLWGKNCLFISIHFYSLSFLIPLGKDRWWSPLPWPPKAHPPFHYGWPSTDLHFFFLRGGVTLAESEQDWSWSGEVAGTRYRKCAFKKCWCQCDFGPLKCGDTFVKIYRFCRNKKFAETSYIHLGKPKFLQQYQTIPFRFSKHVVALELFFFGVNFGAWIRQSLKKKKTLGIMVLCLDQWMSTRWAPSQSLKMGLILYKLGL